MSVKPIPEGYSTVTPYLVLDKAAEAIDFYKRAFGAQETVRMADPMGKIMHAELKIGNSMIMLGDEMPGTGARSPHSLGGTSGGIMLYVNDVDATFSQAVSTGAKVEMPLANMFWGDRYGKLTDPFGHSWSLATHIEDVAPADMKRRMEEAMAQMGQARKSAT
jgi:PhnB protein